MTAERPLRVILASNFIRDERYGSSKVPLRLAAELGGLGLEVTPLFAEDLPGIGHPRLAQVSSPLRVAMAVAARGAEADVVDIAGGDAWLYARWARRRRPRQAVVSRSNGLWYRALPFKGGEGRSRARRAASAIFQRQIVCRWERASIRRADLALFGARVDAEAVVDSGWKRAEQVAVISPGVDDFFASTVPLDSRAGVFYVGTFIRQKGGDVAAAAMSRVLARRPEAAVTFVGPGVAEGEILGRFEAAVRARVRIVDKVPASAVAHELAAGAVLLFPSLYEGFGMVVLEAMRAGLAVVSTPTGAGVEIIRDGENGLLVPFSDVEATAAAVERLLAEPALRMRLARAAMEEARGRSWAATARALAEAYRRALGLAAVRGD